MTEGKNLALPTPSSRYTDEKKQKSPSGTTSGIVQHAHNITFTLTLYFILMATIPLAVVVAIAIQRVNKQGRDQSYDQMQLVTEVRYSELQRWLDGGKATLKTILTDTTQNQRMLSLLEGATLPSSLPTTQRTVSRFLNDQLEAQSIFTEYFVYNLSGDIAVSTNNGMTGRNILTQPYFSISLKNTTDLYRTYFDDQRDQIALIIYTPILNANQDQVGVLAGLLNMDTLDTIMSSQSGLGETGESYLVSASPHMLITPARNALLSLDSYDSFAITAATQGENGASEYRNYQNVKVVGAYRWIPEMGVGLIAEIEQEEAFAASRDVRNLSLFASLVAILAATVIGAFLAVRFTTPISLLTRTANAITAGDLSQRAEVTVKNEIGLLAQAFNLMTGQLVENIREITETNHALQIARAQAQEATRLKSEFLAVISHELRTPLNAILGFSGIMLMLGNLDEKNTHQLRRIQANSERLLSLINDILDISRIEAGRLDITPAPTSIRDLVFKLQKQLSILAERKQLDFQMTVQPEVPNTLLLDSDALTKIISNLVSNAIKFTEQGSVSLEVSWVDNQLVIRVDDTGIGVPPHMQNVIFEAFRQVDSSSKRAHGGTGLGLAIVHSITVAMQGSIKLDSAVGKGSTFEVCLPMQTED